MMGFIDDTKIGRIIKSDFFASDLDKINNWRDSKWNSVLENAMYLILLEGILSNIYHRESISDPKRL